MFNLPGKIIGKAIKAEKKKLKKAVTKAKKTVKAVANVIPHE